jgi:hypothetical protein
MIKFMKHYVTDGKTKARVWYSLDNRRDGRRCVSLYAKDYEDGRFLGQILPDQYVNNTDFHTDYFEKGRAVLFEGHDLYPAARQRAESRGA